MLAIKEKGGKRQDLSLGVPGTEIGKFEVENIAKGTTDPRVEFTSQHHSSQLTNLEHLTISESRLSINFKISTKRQFLDQT